MKVLFISLLFILSSNLEFAQTNKNNSYNYIIKEIYDLANLCDQNTSIRIDKSGQSYIYIYDTRLDGLTNEEKYLAIRLSTLFTEMIYININSKLTQKTDFETFTDYLSTLGFAGIKFETTNNIFTIPWTEINKRYLKKE